MTLLVEKGTFTKTTQTTGVPFTQTVNLSNGSLTPKVIWLWSSGQTTNDGTYVDDSRTCYGFSDTANDCCFCTRVDESAELETNLFRDDAVITIISLTANTEVSRADVSSVAAGSFTLNWAVQSDSSAMVIHYMVAGGTDITNVSVFKTTVGATSTGNKSYNGSGTTFTPDFGMMITGPDGASDITNTLQSSADNSAFSIGAMKSTTARWVIWKRDETVGTSDSDMFHSASTISYQGSNATGAQTGAADFVSFNSAAGGGITINVTDGYPSTTTIFMFLLIKGGTWDVGSFQQNNGTGTQDVTLAPSNLNPELVFLGGINTATTGSVVISSHMGLGGSDGTHDGAMFAGSTSDLATYETCTTNLNTKCYRISTPAATASSSTTNAECSMNDMATAGKFQLNWSTADATQRRMVYWALGTAGNTDYTRSMSTETVSISDSIARSFGAVRSMSTETVNISEAIARKLDAIRNPQETTAISESLTRMLSATRTLPETTTISEQLVKSKGQSRNPTENVTIGESLARMLAATRNPQETTAVSENLSRMLAANRTLSENTTISESLAAARLFIRALATETVTVSDSISRMLAANRTLSDTVIVSDNLARMLAASRALTTETVAVSDSITRMLAVTRTLSDTVSKGENITRQLAASRSLATETTNITEQLNRMLAATRVISQTVSISEQLDFTYTAGGGGPTNYQRTITETTNISESLLRMLAATRALAAENTAISESLQRSVGRNRTINENVSIGESLTRKLDAFRTNIESTTIGESLNRMLAATRAIPTQTVSIGESLVKQLGATRTLIENTISSDNLSRKLDAFRTLIETTSISDILDYVYGAVGARHYFVELIENVSISDSVRTWIEYLKIFPGKDAARQKVETVPDKRKSPNWWRSTWYTLTRKGRKGTSSLSSG